MTVSEIVNQFTVALREVDSEKPEEKGKPYKPGIGPFTESGAIEHALSKLRASDGWKKAETEKGYPSDGRMHCDLYIPHEWAIEVKLLRPFGDNGREMEHWSESALHPYEGNKSSVGDALKLQDSGFSERKAVLIYGFEHDPPEIDLEPTIEAFELIAEEVRGVNLGPRAESTETGLVHPVHEQVRTCGWEVRG